MNIDLEKVDAVIERTGVSYKDAKDALEKCGGDVVDAIIFLEEQGDSMSASFSDNLGTKGDKVLEKLKEILREGNVNKITIKKDGEIIANIPINAGVLGFALSPLLGTLGITAAILTKHTIEITKEDGEVIDLKEASEYPLRKTETETDKENCDSSDYREDDLN